MPSLLPLLLLCAAGRDELDPATCHALVVGVLEWKDPSFQSFSKEDRQDVRFAETLVELGVPRTQVTVLLDQEATRAAIEEHLARVASESGPGSTLLFYYAGHGTREGGSACFANYDMTGATDGFAVDRIGEIVGDHFAGERALLFADCCHSGSLTHVVDRLGSAGIEAACVTSVVEESTSTGNWTFTQTLVEAFGGDASLDADGDGAIDRTELEQAVGGAMAARESQVFSAHAVAVPPHLRLAHAHASPAAARLRQLAGDAPIKLGDHARDLDHDGAPVRIVGLAESGDCLVRTYADATHADAARPRDRLEPIRFDVREVGTAVGVRIGPDLVAARFEPLPADFDPDRACMVEWKGTWYRALVLREESGGSRIHYVGFGKNWDERVGPDRIRRSALTAPATPVPATPAGTGH